MPASSWYTGTITDMLVRGTGCAIGQLAGSAIPSPIRGHCRAGYRPDVKHTRLAPREFQLISEDASHRVRFAEPGDCTPAAGADRTRIYGQTEVMRFLCGSLVQIEVSADRRHSLSAKSLHSALDASFHQQ